MSDVDLQLELELVVDAGVSSIDNVWMIEQEKDVARRIEIK